MQQKFLFLLFAVFCVACNTKNNTNYGGHISIQYDTIQIPITAKHSHNYSYIVGYSSDNLDLIYAYNHFLHNIDIFDVTNKKCLNSIPLEREGPNGVNNFSKFVVCDSAIYIDSGNAYYSINFSGKVETKFNRNQISNFPYADFNLTGKGGITMANYKEMFVNCTHKAMPVPVYENKTIHGIGYIRFDSETFEMFDISLPKINGNYGHFETPHINWVGDKIIYNFPYSSSIYVYSINEGTQKEYEVNSVFTKNTADKLDNNADMIAEVEYQMFSLQFLSVKYDPFRNLYYRVHTAPIDNTNKLYDRELYLTIMDNQFNSLKEIKLPEGVYSSSYIAARQGIIFQIRSSSISDADEDTMYLLQMEISKN